MGFVRIQAHHISLGGADNSKCAIKYAAGTWTLVESGAYQLSPEEIGLGIKICGDGGSKQRSATQSFPSSTSCAGYLQVTHVRALPLKRHAPPTPHQPTSTANFLLLETGHVNRTWIFDFVYQSSTSEPSRICPILRTNWPNPFSSTLYSKSYPSLSNQPLKDFLGSSINSSSLLVDANGFSLRSVSSSASSPVDSTKRREKLKTKREKLNVTQYRFPNRLHCRLLALRSRVVCFVVAIVFSARAETLKVQTQVPCHPQGLVELADEYCPQVSGHDRPKRQFEN
uniref:(California timema) hypothetical protein n=1 Tax=Timema californicum TaxID=61474 RepID=A0A7R9JAU8_TIMCA|nr:unnamed protein product [Timema californicum]